MRSFKDILEESIIPLNKREKLLQKFNDYVSNPAQMTDIFWVYLFTMLIGYFNYPDEFLTREFIRDDQLKREDSEFNQAFNFLKSGQNSKHTLTSATIRSIEKTLKRIQARKPLTFIDYLRNYVKYSLFKSNPTPKMKKILQEYQKGKLNEVDLIFEFVKYLRRNRLTFLPAFQYIKKQFKDLLKQKEEEEKSQAEVDKDTSTAPEVKSTGVIKIKTSADLAKSIFSKDDVNPLNLLLLAINYQDKFNDLKNNKSFIEAVKQNEYYDKFSGWADEDLDKFWTFLLLNVADYGVAKATANEFKSVFLSNFTNVTKFITFIKNNLPKDEVPKFIPVFVYGPLAYFSYKAKKPKILADTLKFLDSPENSYMVEHVLMVGPIYSFSDDLKVSIQESSFKALIEYLAKTKLGFNIQLSNNGGSSIFDITLPESIQFSKTVDVNLFLLKFYLDKIRDYLEDTTTKEYNLIYPNLLGQYDEDTVRAYTLYLISSKILKKDTLTPKLTKLISKTKKISITGTAKILTNLFLQTFTEMFGENAITTIPAKFTNAEAEELVDFFRSLDGADTKYTPDEIETYVRQAIDESYKFLSTYSKVYLYPYLVFKPELRNAFEEYFSSALRRSLPREQFMRVIWSRQADERLTSIIANELSVKLKSDSSLENVNVKKLIVDENFSNIIKELHKHPNWNAHDYVMKLNRLFFDAKNLTNYPADVKTPIEFLMYVIYAFEQAYLNDRTDFSLKDVVAVLFGFPKSVENKLPEHLEIVRLTDDSYETIKPMINDLAKSGVVNTNLPDKVLNTFVKYATVKMVTSAEPDSVKNFVETGKLDFIFFERYTSNRTVKDKVKCLWRASGLSYIGEDYFYEDYNLIKITIDNEPFKKVINKTYEYLKKYDVSVNGYQEVFKVAHERYLSKIDQYLDIELKLKGTKYPLFGSMYYVFNEDYDYVTEPEYQRVKETIYLSLKTKSPKMFSEAFGEGYVNYLFGDFDIFGRVVFETFYENLRTLNKKLADKFENAVAKLIGSYVKEPSVTQTVNAKNLDFKYKVFYSIYFGKLYQVFKSKTSHFTFEVLLKELFKAKDVDKKYFEVSVKSLSSNLPKVKDAIKDSTYLKLLLLGHLEVLEKEVTLPSDVLNFKQELENDLNTTNDIALNFNPDDKLFKLGSDDVETLNVSLNQLFKVNVKKFLRVGSVASVLEKVKKVHRKGTTISANDLSSVVFRTLTSTIDEPIAVPTKSKFSQAQYLLSKLKLNSDDVLILIKNYADVFKREKAFSAGMVQYLITETLVEGDVKNYDKTFDVVKTLLNNNLSKLDDVKQTLVQNYISNDVYVKFKEVLIEKSPLPVLTKVNNKEFKKLLQINNLSLNEQTVNEILKENNIDFKKIKLKTKEEFKNFIETLDKASVKVFDKFQKEYNNNFKEVNASDDEKDRIAWELAHYLAKPGTHGDTMCRILKVYEITPRNEAEFNDFVKKYDNLFRDKAFHGTGSLAANFIIRFGFRVVSQEFIKAGRALGNGIYFTNVLDKSLGYVGDHGWTRSWGTKGFLLDIQVALGKRKEHYAYTNTFRSPEWCVFYPGNQIKIIKAYFVEIVKRSRYIPYLEEKFGKIDYKFF